MTWKQRSERSQAEAMTLNCRSGQRLETVVSHRYGESAGR